MDIDPALTRHLYDLEERLLRPDVRASRDELDALIDDDFIELGASGRTYDKRSVIEALVSDPAPVPRALSHFETRLIAPGVVLATYRANRHTNPPVESIRSSVWRKHGDRWLIVFHQGTPVPAR
jgi:glyoxylase I family protein